MSDQQNLSSQDPGANPSLQLSEQFDLNLSALKEFMPDLYERFYNYKPQISFELLPTNDAFDLQFLPNKVRVYNSNQPYTDCCTQADNLLNSGSLSYVRSRYGKDCFNQIHFRYYNEMIEVASKCCDFNQKVAIKDLGYCPNVVIFGCGLGYHVVHLYSQIEIYNMLVVEPNADLFYASLYTTNWHGLLHFLKDNGYHLQFLVSSTKDNFVSKLKNYYYKVGHHLTSSFWAIIHYHSPQIDSLVDLFKVNYNTLAVQGGFFDDSMFAISHAFHNFRDSQDNLFVRSDVKLADQFRNYPVFIIGSGPSLKDDLEFIKQNKDKAIIVSCGSSIEVLHKAGIKPTFLANIERVKAILDIFAKIKDDDFFKDIILLTTEISHPKVVEHFSRRILFFKEGEGSLALFRQTYPQLSNKFATLEYINPLVSNLAIRSLLYLGFREIYLFGLDNGSVNPQQRHHEECDYYKEIDAFYDTQDFFRLDKEVPGNFEPKVYTNYLYNLAVDIIEKSYQYLQNINGDCKDGVGKLYNCSNGMLIKSAQPVHSYDLDFSEREKLDFDAFWKELSTHKSQAFNFSDETFASLMQKLDLELFKKVSNNLIELLRKREHGTTILSYVDWMCSIQKEINSYNNADTLGVYVVLKDSFKYFMQCINNILFFSKDRTQAIKDADFCIELAIYFLEDAQKLYGYLPNYCSDDHREYVGWQVGWNHELSKAKMVGEY